MPIPVFRMGEREAHRWMVVKAGAAKVVMGTLHLPGLGTAHMRPRVAPGLPDHPAICQVRRCLHSRSGILPT